MSQSTPANKTGDDTSTIRRVGTRNHILAAIVGSGFVVAAGVIAPGDSPGWWAWTRLLVAAGFAGIALAVIDTSRQPNVPGRGTASQLLIVGALLLVAIILSATFTALAALFAVLVVGLVILHLNARGPSSLLVSWALLGMLIPLWVWSAFDAWERMLLWLIPLGVVGIISLEHALRADLYSDAVRERYAAWLGILGMTAMLLAAAMLTSIDRQWVSVGAAGIVTLTVIDLIPPRRAVSEAVPSITLPSIALLVLMLSWLAAL